MNGRSIIVDRPLTGLGFSWLLILLVVFLLALSACSWRRPYHPTPLEALTEFPDYLGQENLSSVSVLQEEVVAGGRVLLYRYPVNRPRTASTVNCIATTFVTQENNNGWRAQSASKLGCDEYAFSGFVVTFTVGGNITELSTVYGLSQEGNQVRVEWSDGSVQIVPLVNNVFLKSRPETLHVKRVELLNGDGLILDSVTW